MLIRNCSSIAMVLGMLTLIGGAAGGPGQTDPAAPPSPEIVAKLVAQLGAADFRTRQQASDQLEKLGAPVLPALRKAVRANLELEVKRRIEIVATRIENALLKTEENRWQALDALRRGIKDRVVKILTRTPALNDHQVVSAIYLLSVGRSPADDEVNRVQKQFAENQNRRAGVLQLTRSLVQGKEFSAKVAAANARLVKVQQDLFAEMGLARRLARMNGDEIQKVIAEVAESVKAVKSDEQLVDLAFLVTVSRFPKASDATSAVAHLKRARDRAMAISDLFWALMNTKEFAIGP